MAAWSATEEPSLPGYRNVIAAAIFIIGPRSAFFVESMRCIDERKVIDGKKNISVGLILISRLAGGRRAHASKPSR